MRNLGMIVLILVFACTAFGAEQPLLKQKRTCQECRRLADKGAYEESIKAYQEFIDTNKGSFQIDDAYFAIADIYDTKLFDFQNALPWYGQLIKNYSDSTLAALAYQRINYIAAYADYGFKPLALFERVRSVEYAQKKEIPTERDKILNQVSSLINEYPKSNLAPVMQHWLANQYRLFAPDKAVEAYIMLRNNYIGHSEAKETMLEIGETYYNAARYKESVTAFEQALKETPELTKTINSQIRRAHRNIRRDNIANLSIIICGILFAGSLLIKPRCISLKNIVRSVIIFALSGVLLFAGAWLIRSQFDTLNHLILIATLFAASIGLGSFVSIQVARKMKNSHIAAALLGSMTGVIFLLAGMYLTIYYVYVHYLVIFKL